MSRSSSVKSVFPCVECSKEYDEESELNGHLKETHNWTPDEIAAGGKEYEVEEIMGHRYCKEKKEYLYIVKWKDYEGTTEESKQAFTGTTILTEYKINNLLDDSEPPTKRGKRSSSRMPVVQVEDIRKSARKKSSTKGRKNSKAAPKQDDDDLFIKNRKMESVLGYNYSAEKGFLYLVQFDKKENDQSREESCRLIGADQLWKSHPEMLRTFFESNLLQSMGDTQEDGE